MIKLQVNDMTQYGSKELTEKIDRQIFICNCVQRQLVVKNDMLDTFNGDIVDVVKIDSKYFIKTPYNTYWMINA